MTKETLLDKLAKLKAHAESAESIGNEKEAQAFAEMLQNLCHKHKVSMSEIEFQDLNKDEPVGEHDIDYEKAGLEVNSRRCKWQEQLASIVARAHFCRILVIRRSSRIILVGRESDAAIAEYVFVTLARAITKLSVKAYDAFYYQCEKDGNTSPARGYKRSYIDSFVSRLSVRLDMAKEKMKAESGSTALVRVETAVKEVDNFMDGNYHGKADRLGGNTNWNMDGIRDGRAAANSYDLDGKSVSGGTSSTKQLS